jgi:hypothetical protein
MAKPVKRIHSIIVKRMLDDSPDTSWLGEYSNKATSPYSIDRAHSEDCLAIESNHREAVDLLERIITHVHIDETGSDYYDADAVDLLLDAQQECMECTCSGGDMGRNEYRYFNPSENYAGDTPENIRKYTRQDYERMESLYRGDWCFIGIMAEAQYSIGDNYAPIQELTSGGLWGIESNSGTDYLDEVEAEQLHELKAQLAAIGFSKRAIAEAFKNVQHKEA